MMAKKKPGELWHWVRYSRARRYSACGEWGGTDELRGVEATLAEFSGLFDLENPHPDAGSAYACMRCYAIWREHLCLDRYAGPGTVGNRLIDAVRASREIEQAGARTPRA